VQDAYAITSYERAIASINSGKFADEIVPVKINDKETVKINLEYHSFTLQMCFFIENTRSLKTKSLLSLKKKRSLILNLPFQRLVLSLQLTPPRSMMVLPLLVKHFVYFSLTFLF